MPKRLKNSDITYWTYGDSAKPPLLLIHGFTGSHEGFQYIIPKLEKDFFIIVPDLPGFGESPVPEKPWTVDELARHTNTFVASLGLNKQPYLVSHSLGSLVAASMLGQRPELFAKKTVFISPVATRIRLFDSRKVGSLLSALHYGLGRQTGKAGSKLVKSKTISRTVTNILMTTKHPVLQEQIQQHHFKNLEYISSIDYYHFLQRDIIRRGIIDYKLQLRSSHILLIAGNKDKVTPIKGARLLARELPAQLEIIENVGHLAHYETPDEISKALCGFLE